MFYARAQQGPKCGQVIKGRIALSHVSREKSEERVMRLCGCVVGNQTSSGCGGM